MTSLFVFFLVFLIFTLTLYLLLSRKPRKTPPYTGGETLEPSRIVHENFYQTFYSLFPRTYSLLEKMHDEDLDNYLYTILLTTSLLLLLAAAWGWLPC